MRAFLLLVVAAFPSMPMISAAAAQQLPRMTRQIVLARADSGYRWELVSAPVPPIGEHDVLVKVHAVSLNHPDLDLLAPAASSRNRDPVGLVAGSDAAGEVIATGADVKGSRKGQRVTNTFFQDWTDGPFSQTSLASVYGWTINGVFSEYVVLADTSVVPIPAELSDEEAATLPTSAVTAWSALTKGRALKRGDVVLVQGTGGVSTFAPQFAAEMGAHVIVTSSSDEKLVRARELGARDVINYRSMPQWADRARRITHSRGVDLVVDVGGKATLGQSVEALADSGLVSIVGGLTGYDGQIPAYGLLMRSAGAQAVFVGSRADFIRMNGFIHAHRIRPVVDRVFPLEQYQEALDYFRAGNFVGKIVIRFP